MADADGTIERERPEGEDAPMAKRVRVDADFDSNPIPDASEETGEPQEAEAQAEVPQATEAPTEATGGSDSAAAPSYESVAPWEQPPAAGQPGPAMVPPPIPAHAAPLMEPPPGVAAVTPAPPAGPAGSISNDELVSLLTQRENARVGRDWGMSDSLRTALEQRGVSVTDGRRSSGTTIGIWTCTDGRTGVTHGPDFFASPPEVAPTPAAVPPPPGPTGPGVVTNEELEQLLKNRSDARSSKDYGKSDTIRTQLEARGVHITDATRSWTASDGRSGSTSGPNYFNPVAAAPQGYGQYPQQGYPQQAPQGYPQQAPPPPPQQASGPLPPGALSDTEIHDKLVAREKSRVGRDYAASDRQRDELQSAGVYVHDNEKRWGATDGRTGQIPNASGAYGAAAPAANRGGYNAPPPPPAAYGGGGSAAYGGGGYGYGGYGGPPPPPHYGGPPPQYQQGGAAPGYGQPPPGYGQGYGYQQPPPSGYGGY